LTYNKNFRAAEKNDRLKTETLTSSGHHTKVLHNRIVKGSPLPKKLIEENRVGHSFSSAPGKPRPDKTKSDKFFKGKTKAQTRDIDGRLRTITPNFLGANLGRSQHGSQDQSWDNNGELQDQVDNKFS
jgi:hypothetical protein